jgi:hypothetical protein
MTRARWISVLAAVVSAVAIAAARGATEPRMSLSIRPAAVGACHGATLRFRVGVRRRPLAGAIVRLAGHAARTSRAGTAAIAVSLRPGRWIAVATKRGYRSARRIVRARACASGRPAPPRDEVRGAPSTFDGRCQFTGRVTFQPPLNDTPHDIAQHVYAPGTCSGTFVDPTGHSSQLAGAPVTYVAAELSRGGSCASGTARGKGSLLIAGTALHFDESETRAGVFVVASADGADGGSARGYAAPTPDQSPVAALQQCAGAGIARASVTIGVASLSPISG